MAAELKPSGFNREVYGLPLETFEDLVLSARKNARPGEKSPFDLAFPPNDPDHHEFRFREYPHKYLFGERDILYVLYTGIPITDRLRVAIVERQMHGKGGISQSWHAGHISEKSLSDPRLLMGDLVGITLRPQFVSLAAALSLEINPFRTNE